MFCFSYLCECCGVCVCVYMCVGGRGGVIIKDTPVIGV